MQRCWSTPPNNRLRVINLLVCRLQLGINPSRTTKTLLGMLKPKIVNIMQFIQHTLGHEAPDRTTIISDIESAVIEYLLHHYVLGERGYPQHYLFGPHGAMNGWKLNYVNAARKYSMLHYTLADDVTEFETNLLHLNSAATHGLIHSLPFGYDATTEEQTPTETPEPLQTALDVVNDGVTFPLTEYRVLAFCLKNANPSMTKSPMYGLHAYFAGATGLHRTRVTYLFASASRRLLEATGRAGSTLDERGVKTDATRRKAWASGNPDKTSLTADEIHELLNTATKDGLVLADVVWAYGISTSYYYHLRNKYGGATLEAIRNDLIARNHDDGN